MIEVRKSGKEKAASTEQISQLVENAFQDEGIISAVEIIIRNAEVANQKNFLAKARTDGLPHLLPVSNITKSERDNIIRLYKKIGANLLMNMEGLIPIKAVFSKIPFRGIRPLDDDALIHQPHLQQFYGGWMTDDEDLEALRTQAQREMHQKILDCCTTELAQRIQSFAENTELQRIIVEQVADLIYFFIQSSHQNLKFEDVFPIQDEIKKNEELAATHKERHPQFYRARTQEEIQAIEAKELADIDELNPSGYLLAVAKKTGRPIRETVEAYRQLRSAIDSAKAVQVLGIYNHLGIGDQTTGANSLAYLLSQMPEFQDKEILVEARTTVKNDAELLSLFEIPENIQFIDSLGMNRFFLRPSTPSIQLRGLSEEPYRLEDMGWRELEGLGYVISEEQKEILKNGLPFSAEILQQEVDHSLAVISFEGSSFAEKSLNARSVIRFAQELLDHGYTKVSIILPPSVEPKLKSLLIRVLAAKMKGVTCHKGSLKEMVKMGARAGLVLSVDNGYLHLMSDVFAQMATVADSSTSAEIPKRRLVEISMTGDIDLGNGGFMSKLWFLSFWHLSNVELFATENNKYPSDLNREDVSELSRRIFG